MRNWVRKGRLAATWTRRGWLYELEDLRGPGAPLPGMTADWIRIGNPSCGGPPRPAPADPGPRVERLRYRHHGVVARQLARASVLALFLAAYELAQAVAIWR